MKLSDHVVVGAGLVGSLLALRLKQKGISCDVVEQRQDMRINEMAAGRSINLALSNRGIQTLKKAGLESEILKLAIPMKGRMIHTLDGQLHFQSYSGRDNEYINSISRKALNCMLMDAVENIDGIKIQFGTELKHINTKTNTAEFLQHEQLVSTGFKHIFATDGANSAARNVMMRNSNALRFNYSQTYQSHGYKELTIPPSAQDTFQLEPNALHIWPRGKFMMIALPNPDKTFTATVFLPFMGEQGFDQLQSDDLVIQFFEQYFSDALPLMPDLLDEWNDHPTGHLYTVKCNPWHIDDKLLLLGDAAHAIIPFYGQGMNCGFEDVFVLDQLIDQFGAQWNSIFPAFNSLRKHNADSIADLAEDNFIEMRDTVADPVFMRKRKLETELEKTFPDYFSKYSMVTFREDLSYFEAKQRGRLQDIFLMDYCQEHESWNDQDLIHITEKLQSLNTKL